MMKNHRQSKRLAIVSAIVISALILLGSGGQAMIQSGGGSVAPAASASGNYTFTTGWFGTFIDTLNPFTSYSQLTSWINSNLYLPLVNFDPANHTIQPALASSWTINYSNHTAIFNLNPNAVWSDGTPVTAQDVVYTYNTAEQNFSFISEYTAAVTNVTALGPHQVMIQFNGVLWEMFAAYVYVVPYHVWKNVNAATYPGYSANGTSYFVGDGPFVLTKYVVNQYAEIQKNAKWFIPSQVPKVSTVIFQEFGSQSSAISALQSGAIQGLSRILPANIGQFQNNSNFKVTQSPSLEYMYLAFNLDPNGTGNPAAQNLSVRQAIAHALNYTYLADTVYHGYASTLASVLAPTNTYYDHNLQPYSYNVTLAKQMLDQAGFNKTVNGVRENSTGAQLSFSLLVPSGDTEAVNLAQLIATNLSAIGVKMTVQAESTGSMAATIWASNGTLGQDTDLWDWFDNVQAAPQLLSVFLSGQVVTGTSDSGFNNSTYDSLWTQLLNASTPAQAKNISNEMQQMLYTQLPYLPLVAPTSINVWSTSYTNINSSFPGGPFGGMDYLTFIQVEPANSNANPNGGNNFVLYGIGAAIVVIIGIAAAVRVRGRDK